MSGECEVFRLHDAGAAAGGRRFRVEIPPASPLFAGHFPGHPVLPGIVHLALVERALRDVSGAGSLSAVRGLKLRRPVCPGDSLELFLGAPTEDGWYRFDVRHGEDPVSGGAVRIGACDEAGWEATPSVPPAGGESPPVEALLPHAPPARFVQGILTATAEEIVCVAEIPLLHPLVESDRIAALAGIETAAQAAAVLEALNRRQDGAGPRIGYLVGIRQAHFAVPFLPPGRPLRAVARLQGAAHPLSIYDIAVGEPGRETVTGTISTFIAGAEDRSLTLTRGG